MQEVYANHKKLFDALNYQGVSGYSDNVLKFLITKGGFNPNGNPVHIHHKFLAFKQDKFDIWDDLIFRCLFTMVVVCALSWLFLSGTVVDAISRSLGAVLVSIGFSVFVYILKNKKLNAFFESDPELLQSFKSLSAEDFKEIGKAYSMLDDVFGPDAPLGVCSKSKAADDWRIYVLTNGQDGRKLLVGDYLVMKGLSKIEESENQAIAIRSKLESLNGNYPVFQPKG